MIDVDGTHGEGGGQILRTALAMSVLTGQALRIRDIRGRRPKPGLMPQHLQAVHAAAAISQARVQGAKLGSMELRFEPRSLNAGDYSFDIGTAGAVTLVLQTVTIPLSFAPAASHVTVVGGTHVPWSPSFHYLDWHWLHYLRCSGYPIRAALDRPGFYPKGGGRVSAEFEPATELRPLSLLDRGRLRRVHGLSMVANLDVSIAERQRHQAMQRLVRHGVSIDVGLAHMRAYSPGTMLLLIAEFEHSQCCYAALGARGKPAERVADEAVDALEAFLATDAAIDEHLADQLIVPLSAVAGRSELRPARITQHLVTNADVVRLFLPVDIVIDGSIGTPGSITIQGRGPGRLGS
jgi:RNA 3'-terminal phosphate cyclase (ATP)